MNVTLNANDWFFDAEYELEAGVIDETALHVFTHGQCHSLALALYEATGWEIVGSNTGDTAPDHVAVLAPVANRVLDIDGLSTIEEWLERNNHGQLTYHDPAELYGAFDGDYREPEVDIARHWVAPVLREYVPVSQWPNELVA